MITSDLNKVMRAYNYAVKCHTETNHTYDGKHYSIHLKMVYDIALEHIKMIPLDSVEIVLSACCTHDVIEDCRQTYNDVKAELGEDIANIVYALSNEKGKNRKERASDLYYFGIRNTAWATYVKFCDRLANVKYSKDTNSKMLSVYQKENSDFVKSLCPDNNSLHNYNKMILELDYLLGVS
jgi:(p)ppGpp synthase/HD superfamily hydrolase